MFHVLIIVFKKRTKIYRADTSNNWKEFDFYSCLKKRICHIKTSLSQVKDIAEIILNNTVGFVYEKDTYDNDYIILKLGSPLQFNENVQPACLPSSSSYLGLDSTKTSCFTSGWGKLNFSKCNSINFLCSCFSERNNFSSMCFHVNSWQVQSTYGKVTSSRPVYYSILYSFPLHKQSENP